MQKENNLAELIVRTSKSFNVLVLTLWGCLVGYMGYEMRNQLFKWDDFNPNGYNTLIFLLFLSVGIFTLINTFDNRPRMIIDKEGIWKRRSILPYSSLILVKWREIQYFYLFQKTQKNVTSYLLILKKRETEEDIKVELADLDKSVGTILSLVRQYAQKHGIHDLGEEVG